MSQCAKKAKVAKVDNIAKEHHKHFYTTLEAAKLLECSTRDRKSVV